MLFWFANDWNIFPLHTIGTTKQSQQRQLVVNKKRRILQKAYEFIITVRTRNIFWKYHIIKTKLKLLLCSVCNQSTFLNNDIFYFNHRYIDFTVNSWIYYAKETSYLPVCSKQNYLVLLKWDNGRQLNIARFKTGIALDKMFCML